MHQFSFDFSAPFFDLGGWQVALQIITFENVYGLDPELTRVEEDGGRWSVTAEGLTWAGGQRRRTRRAPPPPPPPPPAGAARSQARPGRWRWPPAQVSPSAVTVQRPPSSSTRVSSGSSP